jgi:exodeoxyribonuclease VII large subunit
VSPRFFALSEITARLRKILSPYKKRFWVRAEISTSRTRGAGHFYADLIEIDGAGQIIAKMELVLFATELESIRAKFEAAGVELLLANGTKIGIYCSLRYHERYGLSLMAHDMDPAFALGELELKRRRILATLKAEGLLGKNAQRTVPLLPNRVALITSPEGAAKGDFVGTLRQSGFGFRIYLAPAMMQGERTERTVLAALDLCASLPVDVVVIARGGGNKSGLTWFDNDAIARRIADYPLPVFTAIGHDFDKSVLDVVAAYAYRTPSAVAEALVKRFFEVQQRIEAGAARLRSVWQLRHGSAGERLRNARADLHHGSLRLLEHRRAQLLGVAQAARVDVQGRMAHEHARLGEARTGLRGPAVAVLREGRTALGHMRGTLDRGCRAALRVSHARLAAQRSRFSPRRLGARFRAERDRLHDRRRTLRAADPSTALRRGFSLTQTTKGALVRSIAQVAAGDVVTIQVADGSFDSTVGAARRTRVE